MHPTFEVLLKSLVIIAGQWRTATLNKAELEKQFSSTLDKLEKVTGKTREALVQILLQYIEKGVVPT